MRRSRSRRGPPKGRKGEAVQTETKSGVGHGGRGGGGEVRATKQYQLDEDGGLCCGKTKTETSGGGIKMVGEATSGK